MKDLITIDLKSLNKEKPVGLILAPNGALAKEAELELTKILEAKRLIEDIETYVKGRLAEEMGKKKLIKVKGDTITISRRYYGSRYSLDKNAKNDFIKKVSYDRPDVEKIDLYLNSKGELPKGIKPNTREEKVTITEREDET